MPIDLTPLFPIATFPDSGKRHRSALEWFLRSLQNGRPYDPWRLANPPAAEEGRYPHLPRFYRLQLKTNRKANRASPGMMTETDSFLKKLREELPKWRHNRSVYPGWLIAPEQVREIIWNSTKHWLHCFVQVRYRIKPSRRA